nr:uncharacterized protein LOC117220889 [Megalopta genalis]XP_033327215.1 uncharacterized protein LOC117220889 [Megalopta genalis]XP_033327216.1 uncharacterized protein LOC117220889 [Megalopta genalis]XP_033327218.1 uncharacterized protein LOC117220889 [Megalopta genalis]
MLQAMPEIAISPKSLPSLSISAGSKDETCHIPDGKRLPGCVRCKFQPYSHLPVRCYRPTPHYRPPRTSLRLTGLAAINCTGSINTAKSCPENLICRPMFRIIGSASCKKSLSMIDLTQSNMEAENGDLGSDSCSTLEKLEDTEKVYEGNDVGLGVGIKNWMDGFVSAESEEGGLRFFENPRKAASLVCRVLVVNAWRRRREEVDYLRGTIDDLTRNTGHLQLQISVLRRLIDTENSRVGRLTSEANRLRMQLDEAVKGRDALKREKEKIEEEMRRLHEVAEGRLVVVENVQNELITAQNQVQALDEQISRDREKLLKLREDKRMLIEKVTACETLAKERGARAEKSECAAEELQLKLATHIVLTETSQKEIQRYIKELKISEAEIARLEKRLQCSEDAEKSLRLRATLLESKLNDREAVLRCVESTCNSQLAELNDLRNRLIRQSQDGGWSSRMLQIAGTVVRAPRAILRSLLSTTGPVLTP